MYGAALAAHPLPQPGRGAGRLCQIDHTIPAGTPGLDHLPTQLRTAQRQLPQRQTDAGWRLSQPERGRYLWTAPTGHT